MIPALAIYSKNLGYASVGYSPMKNKNKFLDILRLISMCMWIIFLDIGAFHMISRDFFEGFLIMFISLILLKLDLIMIKNEK